jgi:hypothetical protein
MYDFHKMTRNATDLRFYHKSFLRGRPELLNQIYRKTSSKYAALSMDTFIQSGMDSVEESLKS